MPNKLSSSATTIPPQLTTQPLQSITTNHPKPTSLIKTKILLNHLTLNRPHTKSKAANVIIIVHIEWKIAGDIEQTKVGLKDFYLSE